MLEVVFFVVLLYFFFSEILAVWIHVAFDILPIAKTVPTYWQRLLLQGIQKNEFADDIPLVFGEGYVQIGSNIVHAFFWHILLDSDEAGEAEIFFWFGELQDDGASVVEISLAAVADENEFWVF